MDEQSNKGNCPCKDESLTKEVTCPVCDETRIVPMPYIDRVFMCDQHPKPAVCGMSDRTCDACKGLGWEMSGGFGFSKPQFVNSKTGERR